MKVVAGDRSACCSTSKPSAQRNALRDLNRSRNGGRRKAMEADSRQHRVVRVGTTETAGDQEAARTRTQERARYLGILCERRHLGTGTQPV